MLGDRHLTSEECCCVAFSPNGKRLAAGSRRGTVHLHDGAMGANPLRPEKLEGHTDMVRLLAFLADSSLLASGAWDSPVGLWHGATGESLQAPVGHCDRVCSVAFSRSRMQLASASLDHDVRLWGQSPPSPLHLLGTLRMLRKRVQIVRRSRRTVHEHRHRRHDHHEPHA